MADNNDVVNLILEIIKTRLSIGFRIDYDRPCWIDVSLKLDGEEISRESISIRDIGDCI